MGRSRRRRARPSLSSRRPPRTLLARTSPPVRAPTAASGARVPTPEGSRRWRGAPRPLRRASTPAQLAVTVPSGHLSAQAQAGGNPVRLPPPVRAPHGPRSGRDWLGPQMAAAPRRGRSRGGGRAPSRGSCPQALGVWASALERRAGEAPLELTGGGGRICGHGDSGEEEGARRRPGVSRLRRGPMLQGRRWPQDGSGK